MVLAKQITLSDNELEYWLLGVIDIIGRWNSTRVTITSNDGQLTSNIYSIISSLAKNSFMTEGYKPGLIRIQASKIRSHSKLRLDSFLQLENKDIRNIDLPLLINYLSGILDAKAKVIYTNGWNKTNHQEYYLDICSTRKTIINNCYIALVERLDINAKTYRDRNLYRLRIHNKEDIYKLNKLMKIRSYLLKDKIDELLSRI